MNFSGSPEDPHSFAKPELARVSHTYLELNVNFERKVLTGKAILTIKKKPSINELILDNNGLHILNIRSSHGRHLNYRIDTDVGKHPDFGTPIYIELQSETAELDICAIEIEYETDPNSPALNWLTPAQTADNLYPFLLSDNKLIYARTMFPCQDTPSVKFKYTATIIVERTYTVLMSACLENMSRYEDSNLMVEYNFLQTNPIPSYAVIIAVGKLKKKVLNPRTNIFGEYKFINNLNIFHSNIYQTIWNVTERLYGSYLWGTYDICVLPPSIAHFEIECPCVSFISPAILGDECSTIILVLTRNISQNWAGNLVTCLNYEHLWLNISFNCFISRKIICEVLTYKNMKLFLRIDGINILNNVIEKCENKNLLKCLLPDLNGLSPHEVFVPYEHGCIILHCLEDKLGERVFQSFLESYFHKFAYKSINTQDWLNYLHEYIRQCFPDKMNILHNIDWHKIFNTIASRFNVPRAMTAWLEKCYKLAEEWIKYDNKIKNVPSIIINENLYDDIEIIIFVNYLNSFAKNLTERKMQLLLHYYSFETQNDHIRFLWLLLCIKARWRAKVSLALEFAIQFGSPNYACPLFMHLHNWAEVRDETMRTYINNREKMFRGTQKILDFHFNIHI